MLKIAYSDLIINNTPLPRMSYDGTTLTVEFDDEFFRRCKAVFSPVQSFKCTTADCFCKKELVSCRECFKNGVYARYILEDNDSKWIRGLRKNIIDKTDDFTKRARHFVLDLRDDILEVVAFNMEITKTMRVAAHRGFSEKYPENTMAAFRAAIEAGVDEIETDVRVTADGELVLIHDEMADRTTDGTGKICEMTLEELKKLDAGVKKGAEFAGERIPTLRELMELVKDHPTLTLDIELKEYPTEGREALAYDVCDRALAMLDEYGFTERCVINSWNGKLNEYVHEKYGKKYRQHVYYPEEYLGKCTVDPYSYAYCACLFTNNPEPYDYLRSRGVQPWVGAGVKDEVTLDKAIANGACAVTCNNPDEILALLRKKGLHK